jgi:hypothetical protein
MLNLFSDFTTKDWVFLAIGLVGTFGFFQYLLKLSSRVLDWLASRSQKAFEKRLFDIELQLRKVGKARRRPMEFLFNLLQDLVPVIASCMTAGLLLFWGLYSFVSQSMGWGMPQFVIGQGCLFFGLMFFLKIAKVLDAVCDPELVATRASFLIKKGVKKGFISPEEANLKMDKIVTHSCFEDFEKTMLKDLWKSLE